VAGQRPFDGAGADAQAAGGQEVVQNVAADGAGQVDGFCGDDAGGLDDLVAGGVQGDGEAGPVRVGAGGGEGGGGDGDPDCLVDDQEGVDLLGDAGQGAGAQDAAAQHGFLDLEVGRFDLPSLVVKLDQLERGMLAGIEQGGGQPVGPGAGTGRGGDGDLALDDPYLDPAQDREEGAIGQAAQARGLAGGSHPGQKPPPGAGARGGHRRGGHPPRP